MSRPSKPGLSEAEGEVLKALWDHGPATVRQLSDLLGGRGRRWAYTTVATLVQRLAAKGFVESDAREIPHVYRASLSRPEYLQLRLREAADELCGGEAAPLVLALVKNNRFTAEELARFRALIEQASREAADSDPHGKRPTRDETNGD